MTVTNEFLCFELEMGGRILAWFGIIVYGISALVVTQLFFGIHEIEKAYSRCHFPSKCLTLPTYVTDASLLTAILIYAGLFTVSVLLNVGIKCKNHSLILPSVIAYGIESAIYVVGALVMAFKYEHAVIASVFGFIIHWYITVVLFSVYEKIRKENESVPSAV